MITICLETSSMSDELQHKSFKTSFDPFKYGVYKLNQAKFTVVHPETCLKKSHLFHILMTLVCDSIENKSTISLT